MSRAVIFVNGSIRDLEKVRRMILPGDTLLAADGGTRYALAMGLVPALIIGDMDSLTEADRQKLGAAGSELHHYSRDKNETDFELALRHAVETGFHEILVVAALGDRLDQTLGNLSLLTDPSMAGLNIMLDDGTEQAFFIRSRGQIEGLAGDVVSLIPWGGNVTGISTHGLRWPLDGDTLVPYKTRGISNELLGNMAEIAIQSGLLLVIHRRQNS